MDRKPYSETLLRVTKGLNQKKEKKETTNETKTKAHKLDVSFIQYTHEFFQLKMYGNAQCTYCKILLAAQDGEYLLENVKFRNE